MSCPTMLEKLDVCLGCFFCPPEKPEAQGTISVWHCVSLDGASAECLEWGSKLKLFFHLSDVVLLSPCGYFSFAPIFWDLPRSVLSI